MAKETAPQYASLTTRHNSIFRLRLLLIFSLVLAVAICSTVAYYALERTEHGAFEKNYESIAMSALTNAKAITLRKLQSSQVMATLMSQVFPSASAWPLISMDGYGPIANAVAQLSSSYVQSLTVVIDPQQASGLEDHAQQVYKDQGRPEFAGHSDFGWGIWKPDKANSPYADGRSHDTTGATDWGSKHNVMTPVLMHNIPNASALMYNLYSQENRGMHIDSIMDCVTISSYTTSSAASEPQKSSPDCPVITDVLELKVRPGSPAALLFQPIFPAHDPSAFVGFATTSIHWEEVLSSVVPDYVSGLTCVINTASTTFTYEIQNGVPYLMGDGDLHDPAYSQYGRSEILTDIPTGASTSAVYRITVYPTQEMVATFTTNNPLIIALGFFGAIAFCAGIFCAYDYLVRRQATERKGIQEMKRRFVRFISHEIRTPLNTVCMGLELLESELQSGGGVSPMDGSSAERMAIEDEDVDFWQKVTSDVKENAHVAVSILNDLLNYDKLETGEMKLELAKVNIWDLVAKTVGQFQIQAVNRKVALNLHIQGDEVGIEEYRDEEGGMTSAVEASLEGFKTVGDEIRLSQVLRNVISNALKFTPTDGTIDITAYRRSNGLPKAKPLMKPNGKDVAYPALRGGSAVIVIKDSGVGLTKEQLHMLFGEGVQFDANKLQHGGGSGLGLSIAKGIVEQHNGTIHAESDGPGHGTSFVIELPLYWYAPKAIGDETSHNGSMSESFTTASPTASPSVSTRPDDNPSPTRRILVAEDTLSSRKMLIRLLERAGHECVPAANGQEAVDLMVEDMELAQSSRDHVAFDTVLMDHEMPLLTGPEATQKIRELGYEGHIVGVTGNVLEEDIEYFKDHGASDVLPKPICMEDLNNHWQKKRRRRRQG